VLNWTTIVTLALPPLGMVPSAQETVPAEKEHLPWLAVAERNTAPGGRGSVRVTFSDAPGPPFVAVRE
jgi:hypothetical protein